MLADPAEDLAEPALGLDAVELGGAQQREHDRGPLAARIAAGRSATAAIDAPGFSASISTLSLSSIDQRRRAETSMALPTRPIRPLVSTISITSARAGDGGAAGDRAASVSGTKAGGGPDEDGGAGFVPRSRRQRNSRLVCSPCRRATSDTEPPEASTSARIDRFCALVQRRRVVAT